MSEPKDNGRGPLGKRASAMPSAYLSRRTAFFLAVTQRKGMPFTWGKGEKVREDKAWRADHPTKKATKR